MVAVCDADLNQAEKAKAAFDGKPEVHQDYRKLLDRNDIDVIINGTPDHWHTIVNIAACKSGRDVYAEKPMTLTIDEGKLLCKAVGGYAADRPGGHDATEFPGVPKQPSNWSATADRKLRGLGGVALLHDQGPAIRREACAAGIDWDLYQGQAPLHNYCPQRTQRQPSAGGTEYAGGIITDWATTMSISRIGGWIAT